MPCCPYCYISVVDGKFKVEDAEDGDKKGGK